MRAWQKAEIGRRIAQEIVACRGNISEVARRLGLSRQAIYLYIHELGLWGLVKASRGGKEGK